jgi:hypothetical protein
MSFRNLADEKTDRFCSARSVHEHHADHADCRNVDSGAILAIVPLNGVLGYMQERKSDQQSPVNLKFEFGSNDLLGQDNHSHPQQNGGAANQYIPAELRLTGKSYRTKGKFSETTQYL